MSWNTQGVSRHVMGLLYLPLSRNVIYGTWIPSLINSLRTKGANIIDTIACIELYFKYIFPFIIFLLFAHHL
jgi:hypothetical protein